MTPRTALITAAIVLAVGGLLAFFVTPTVTDRLNHQAAQKTQQQAGIKPGIVPGPDWEQPLLAPLTTTSTPGRKK